MDEEDVIRIMLRAEEVLVADEDFIIEEDDGMNKKKIVHVMECHQHFS